MRFREETEQFALYSVQALQLCSMLKQSDMFMSCAFLCSCWCRSTICSFCGHVHVTHSHMFLRCTLLARALVLACSLSPRSVGGGG